MYSEPVLHASVQGCEPAYSDTYTCDWMLTEWHQHDVFCSTGVPIELRQGFWQHLFCRARDLARCCCNDKRCWTPISPLPQHHTSLKSVTTSSIPCCRTRLGRYGRADKNTILATIYIVNAWKFTIQMLMSISQILHAAFLILLLCTLSCIRIASYRRGKLREATVWWRTGFVIGVCFVRRRKGTNLRSLRDHLLPDASRIDHLTRICAILIFVMRSSTRGVWLLRGKLLMRRILLLYGILLLSSKSLLRSILLWRLWCRLRWIHLICGVRLLWWVCLLWIRRLGSKILRVQMWLLLLRCKVIELGLGRALQSLRELLILWGVCRRTPD